MTGVVCTATGPGFATGANEDAKAVAELAKRRFKEGQYDVAARLYMRAYEMSKRPTLLFNAGRAREMLGESPEAVRVYQRYIEVETDVAGREEARVRIQAIEESRGAARKPDPPAADARGKKEGEGSKPDAAKGGDRGKQPAGAEALWLIDKAVPFQKSGHHPLGIRVGPLVFDDVVVRNMPSAGDIADAEHDRDDKSHPKFTVTLSNPGAVAVRVTLKVNLETAAGEVLMTCEGKDTVDAGAHEDHSNLCWVASIRTLDWPRLAKVRIVAAARPK